jgi:hypothetical protein
MTLGNNASLGSFQMGFYGPAAVGWKSTPSFSITSSAYACYTATWDGTTLIGYINGNALGGSTGTPTVDTNAVTSGSPLQFKIGNQWDTVASYFTAYVGEIRLYNVALTPIQVLTDYQSKVASYS